MKVHKSVIIWLYLGCLLILTMVVVGGITRLTNSGLSMVEWKLIMGSVPPLSENDWIETFEKYKQFPEYKEVNAHFSLEEFKSIFWWEYIHRMIGRLLGVVFIIPFLFFTFKRMIPAKLNTKLLIIFGLGALQGFFGWFMVKSGLQDRPDVSHFRLALHLITAFLTFSYIFWVVLGLNRERVDSSVEAKRVLPVLRIFLGVLIVQIIYGAFVAGLNAGFIYNTYPKMGDAWVPEAVTLLSPVYLNFVEGVAGVQFIHRYVAIVLLIVLALIWRRAMQIERNGFQKKSLIILTTALSIQFLLGVITLLYAVPAVMGVLHQLGAIILLGSTVYTMRQFSVDQLSDVHLNEESSLSMSA